MPYINRLLREDLVKGLPYCKGAGELNFVITSLCIEYLHRRGDIEAPGYADYNEIIGVLECAKQEFYRRAVTPYEQNKSIVNGDVY